MKKAAFFVIDECFDDLFKNILTHKEPAFYQAIIYNTDNRIIDTIAGITKKSMLTRLKKEYTSLNQKPSHPRLKL